VRRFQLFCRCVRRIEPRIALWLPVRVHLSLSGAAQLQFGLRVRIDFAVQTDVFKLRCGPFHDFPLAYTWLTSQCRRMPPITSCMSTPLLLSIQAAMKSSPAQVLPV